MPAILVVDDGYKKKFRNCFSSLILPVSDDIVDDVDGQLRMGLGGGRPISRNVAWDAFAISVVGRCCKNASIEYGCF